MYRPVECTLGLEHVVVFLLRLLLRVGAEAEDDIGSEKLLL